MSLFKVSAIDARSRILSTNIVSRAVQEWCVFQLDTFRAQLDLLGQFLQHFTARRALRPLLDGGDLPAFWTWTSDAHLLCAIAAWCMVFGADNENNPTHWKMMFADDHLLVESFRDRLQRELGLPLNAWRAYHRGMLAFRNNYVAHRAAISPAVPNLDTARDVAFLYDEWVRDTARAADVFDFPTLRADAPAMMQNVQAHLAVVVEAARAF